MIGGGMPLAFAVTVGLGLGLLHGASDLHMVDAAQRLPFIACYLAAALAYLAFWQVASAVALVTFLLLSVWHFGHEDASFAYVSERLALGVFIVSAPAVLHRQTVGRLLDLASGTHAPSALGIGLANALAVAGILASAVLLKAAWCKSDARLAATLVATFLLPPLVGFALGFFLLHAAPQTRTRQRVLGTCKLGAYLRLTCPVLAAAALFALIVAAVFVQQEQTGIRSLFAVLAAFALPHMLVLPRFVVERPSPAH
ncbi:beta-carotene 15,15'-dioxygenase, Brp/Blh family [Pseudomonas sp.]|uniref:beta-carotene 15,15'-dioxygenase, Brp/Blh family n=1 Tax=Pseudomonas sp. TaxID=306 RepID=UPI0028A5DB55|nr:beta-carotene 15,15'-dioxygenase, Brp/Blh family [Pseudomonas sp.]